MAAIGAVDRSDVAPLLSDELLPTLLTTVNWRRRRSRIVTWTAGAAAAAVLAIGVLVCAASHSPTPVPTPAHASVSGQPMAQVGTNQLASTVALSGQDWGTFISMNCVCLAPLNAITNAGDGRGPGVTGAKLDGNLGGERGHTATPAAAFPFLSTKSPLCRSFPPRTARFCSSVRCESRPE